jgi:hypothetical protein
MSPETKISLLRFRLSSMRISWWFFVVLSPLYIALALRVRLILLGSLWELQRNNRSVLQYYKRGTLQENKNVATVNLRHLQVNRRRFPFCGSSCNGCSPPVMVGGVKIQNFTFPLWKFHYFDPSPTQFHYFSLSPKICIFHSVAPTFTLTPVALQNRLNPNGTNLLVPSLCGLYNTQRNLHSHSLFFFPEPADFFTRWNQQSSKYPKLFNHKFPQVQIQMSKEA